jgi:ferrous iron transport protein A
MRLQDSGSYFWGMISKRLSEMKPTETGVIGHVDCPEAAMALVEMGCCPGEEVTVAHVSPGNGPMAIFSGGRKVALRKQAAALLWMVPIAVANARNIGADELVAAAV